MSKIEKIWHRLPKETARQFEMFEYFLSLPVGERTSDKVSEKFLKSVVYVRRIRSLNEWNNRAAARDNFRSEQLDRQSIKKAESLAFDWYSWEVENLNKIKDLSNLFINRAVEIARLPIVETIEEITETDDEGRAVAKTIVHKPLRITASDAARHAEAGVILAKYAQEQSANLERAAHPAPSIALPEPDKPISEMSTVELEKFIEERRAAQMRLTMGENVQDIGEQS